jgi:hypothetical protein
MAPAADGQGTYRAYARRRLVLTAYRRGFRDHQVLWRGLWYGLLLMRAIKWTKPVQVLVAREVLKPGDTITITQTKETVGKRRR